MLDWTQSMQQTFEYYVVDPDTWTDTKRLSKVKQSTITFDSDTDTLGSSTIDMDELIDECYIRTYLVANQNGKKYKLPLGTFLYQTPSSSHDSKVKTVSMDGYTPLIELKEKNPLIGYYIPKKENIMSWAGNLTQDYLRAPVETTKSSKTLPNNFVADTEDTWLSYLTDLIESANYTYELDEMGRVLFSPKKDTASLQPVWTYTDDNASILYSDVSVNHDIFGIPNAVEVIYSSGKDYYYTKVKNDDEDSPTSTVNRGRQIVHRVINPSLSGEPSKAMIREYAEQLLKELSTVEYTISYTHAYCPVRVGDCVSINNTRAGLNNIKAKVISQNIKCEPGCPVTEKAVFTSKLWR